MYIKSLQAFVRTIERGSVTEAAHDLSLSQPAVTKHLQTLERHVSTRLLERSSRMVRPTSEGLALYEASHEALATIEAALLNVQMKLTEVEGTIRLFSPACLGAKHIQQFIMEFQDRNPKVKIHFVLDNRQIDLISENFDVALCYDRPKQQATVVRKIGVLKRILVASPEYSEKIGPLHSIDKLSEIDFLTTTSSTSAKETLVLCSNGQEFKVSVEPFLRANNATVIIENLLSGRGVGPVQSSFVSKELKSGALVRVLLDYDFPPSELFIIYPSARFMRPAVRNFIDFLTPRLQQIDGIGRF